MGFLDTYQQRRADLAAPDSVMPAHYRQAAAPVPTPSQNILLPACCNLHRKPQVIVAQRHGSQLKLIGSRQVPSGFDSGSLPPLAELGAFSVIDSADWPGCALCGAKSDPAYNLGSVWWCRCERCAGNILFHCAGNHGGVFHCMNGTLVDMQSMTAISNFALEGWRSGSSTAHQPAPLRREPLQFRAPLSLSLPPVPQIPAPPSATLRIGFRGR